MDNGNGGLSGTDALALMAGNGGGWGNNLGLIGAMNGGFGGFGGDWIGLIAILALLGGGFGNGWGNQFGYQPQYATQDFVQNGFNFNNLLDGNRDILNAIQRDTYDTITAIKDGNASTIREFGNVESAIQALSAQSQKCCCDTLRAIDGVNYNTAMQTSDLKSTMIEQTQRILDAQNQNRIDAMQNRINQLELQNQLAGVVRYPDGFTYDAGRSPFCGGGNCCNYG